MTPDLPPWNDKLSDQPVRLGRRRERDEPDEQDERDGYVRRGVLEPPAEPPWRPPWRLVAAVLVVVVVVSAVWYVDRQDRLREERALESCRRDLQNAVAFSDLRLMAMATYLDPALSATKGTRRGEIADMMAQPARRMLADVERADRVCQAVQVRPWHLALADRRRATTAYSSAFAAHMRGIAGRGRTYYHDTSALQRLREAAGIPVLGGPF